MTPGKAKILLLDDEPNMLDFLRRALRRRYDVTLSSTPKQAKLELEKSCPDIVISDHKMPGASGIQFLAEVQTLCPSAKRVLLTGYSEDDQLQPALESGTIHKHLDKPIDSRAIIAALESLLAGV